MLEIARNGSARNIEHVLERIGLLFATTDEISPEWHVKTQAAFQRYTDNAVSKTINLPPEATPGDIQDACMLAYREKRRGITVYRSGRGGQVLYLGTKKEPGKAYASRESEYSGGCEGGVCPL